jgi:trimethylamine-N-oxide reductase (cytochrome c)
LKKEQNKLPEEKEEKKQSGEVSRRDFLVGAGTVVVGGAVGAGLLSSCGDGEEKTITTTIEKTKTVTTTIGEGAPVTVTETEQVGTEGTITKTTTITGTGEAVGPAYESLDKTVLLTGGMGGKTGDPVSVDVKHGKIVRVRPLHFDDNYTKEELASSVWQWERNGKIFEPPAKSLPNYFSFSLKHRAYSPNRVLYPLKRVDWEPGGDPAKINTQNRGKSKYKRITWDEAAEIVASEIKRIHDTYGLFGIFIHSRAHGQGKQIHKMHGSHRDLLMPLGGYCTFDNNPDSWEGWFWGGKHVAGAGNMGHITPSLNVLKDIIENSEMVVHEGSDWETTPCGFGTELMARVGYYLTEVGIKQVYVCPDLNYAAAVHADKWIPVLPDTDAALQLAILYTWINEGTYDQDYVDTHVYGFDKFKPYVMGDEDGIPKTPEWASTKCGVPEWTIKALAKTWAKKVTSTAHWYGGSFVRSPYSTEPARLEYILLAMQGLGKPGVQMFHSTAYSPRFEVTIPAYLVTPPTFGDTEVVTQKIALTRVPEAVLEHSKENPISWWGGGMGYNAVADQFLKRTYPLPEDQNGSEIHMYWTDCPCATVCWNEGNYWIEAFRSPKIEFMLAQHPWFENDCTYADIILPGTSVFEDKDFMPMTMTYSTCREGVYIHEQAINHMGESKSDYEGLQEVAKKLEKYGGRYPENLHEIYTDGNKTIEEKMKVGYDLAAIGNLISWEDLQKKEYYCIPLASDWKDDSPGLRAFYENPEENPRDLPSGKLEFYSDRIAEYFPDDEGRGPYPRWVEGGPGCYHDERIGGERAKQYPLLVVSNHPRWRHHAQCDDLPWIREIPTSKIKGYDGYMYEPIWINPTDAEARGIKNGDIVKIFNERGVVLGGAFVTERIRPGAVSMDHGARLDLITDKIDRGGSINLITPYHTSTSIAWGQATSGFLAEIEKLEASQMEEWRETYPEAFARDYDPYHGLHLGAWTEGGVD